MIPWMQKCLDKDGEKIPASKLRFLIALNNVVESIGEINKAWEELAPSHDNGYQDGTGCLMDAKEDMDELFTSITELSWDEAYHVAIGNLSNIYDIIVPEEDGEDDEG